MWEIQRGGICLFVCMFVCLYVCLSVGLGGIPEAAELFAKLGDL